MLFFLHACTRKVQKLHSLNSHTASHKMRRREKVKEGKRERERSHKEWKHVLSINLSCAFPRSSKEFSLTVWKRERERENERKKRSQKCIQKNSSSSSFFRSHRFLVFIALGSWGESEWKLQGLQSYSNLNEPTLIIIL